MVVCRPQLLVLMKQEQNAKQKHGKLFELANQLKAGRGLTMAASLLQGDPTNIDDRNTALEVKEVI